MVLVRQEIFCCSVLEVFQWKVLANKKQNWLFFCNICRPPWSPKKTWLLSVIPQFKFVKWLNTAGWGNFSDFFILIQRTKILMFDFRFFGGFCVTWRVLRRIASATLILFSEKLSEKYREPWFDFLVVDSNKMSPKVDQKSCREL